MPRRNAFADWPRSPARHRMGLSCLQWAPRGWRREETTMANQVGREALDAALPDVTSTLTLAGLEQPVEIIRDHFGIPHIRAGSVHDAFFAQGFVHGQDRLWQLEFD